MAEAPITITPLVRQYSLEAHENAPDDTLSQALVSAIRKEDATTASSEQQTDSWQKWIAFGSRSGRVSSDPLEHQSRAVVDLWKRFSYVFAAENDSLQPANSVPSISTLFKAIDQAQAEWDEKQTKGFGVAKGRFLNFAVTMNEYSYLFSVVPSGDKYVSLITGVVSSVVKVSVNHKRIAEGFAMVLSEVSDQLRSVEKIVEISDSNDMRRLVVELYLEVFELLCHTLSWFMSKRKRFSAALKMNFFDETVVKLLSKIEKTARTIDREAKHAAESRIRDIHEVVVGDGAHNVNLLRSVGNQSRRDDQARIHDKLDKMEEQLQRLQQLGYISARTLGAVESQQAYEVQTQTRVIQDVELPEQQLEVEEGWTDEVDCALENEADEQLSRFDIEQLSSRLTEYLDDGRQAVSNALRGTASSLIPSEVLFEMQRWIKTHESKMIWVEGAPNASYGSSLSSAAIRICDIGMQNGMPCVSFFCKLQYGFANARHLTFKEAGLVALLYSVVAQLACLLPTAIPATKSLDEKHFCRLDGSMESIPAALELIRALLVHAPSSLVWVLDGVQLVESKATIPHLQSLLDILRDEETKRISKVCFTTDGNCFALMRATNPRERVDASRTAQGRPGAPLRGGSDVSDLEGVVNRRL